MSLWLHVPGCGRPRWKHVESVREGRYEMRMHGIRVRTKRKNALSHYE